MPYRPEAELKRPDLKGEFICGHCGKTFCHAASLNRHRLNFHGDDQQCLICNTQIHHNDTIRRHMQTEHQIPRVFTCGCCNWTFPDKKELHTHNQSMATTGTPGSASAIAVSSRKPGSLSQHELRGEERSPRGKKRSAKADSPAASISDSENLLAMLNSLLQRPMQDTVSTSNIKEEDVPQPVTPIIPQSFVPQPLTPHPVPNSWVQQLLLVNPALASFFPPAPSSSSSSTSTSSEMEVSKTPEPPTLTSVLSSIVLNNNNIGEASTSGFDDALSGAEEENIDDGKDDLVKAVGPDFLSIRTEQPVCDSMSSGPESGIGSAPMSHTPSPVSSSPVSADVSPTSASDLIRMVQNTKSSSKRRRVDDICSHLVAKKTSV